MLRAVLLLCLAASCLAHLEGSHQGPHGTLSSRRVAAPICDTVPQYSGYFDIDKATDKHYFYWAFESRSNPSNDPVILWMTGGPGCSSELALFAENGPCKVNHNLTTFNNPSSWNTFANLIFIDQPAGTGFSYSKPGGYDSTEAQIGDDMYHFLQAFFQAHPEWQSNEFFIFGESYGGHFAPATAHRVWKGNQDREGLHINLQGLGVGNGLTDPEIQYQFYAQYAYNFTAQRLGKPVISLAQYESMTRAIPQCVSLIQACQKGSSFACSTAENFCNTAMMTAYSQTGLNVYDIRVPCGSSPLCYDFSAVDQYLALPEVLAALHVDTSKSKWSECNPTVHSKLTADWMKNYQDQIPDLLASGIRVLIYAGDCDFICNFLGNKMWTLALDWPSKNDFEAAGDKPWMFNGKEAGLARAAGRLTFLQVHDAGHMVPMDQPAVALEMVRHLLNGQPFAQ